MMRRIRYMVSVCILVLMFAVMLTGCNSDNEMQAKNDELKAILPNEVGFVWMYEGFAEYFHAMEIESIASEGSGYRYTIRGNVADMSGGASEQDFRLTVEYVIQDGVLVQYKEEAMMMDSIFDELELIRHPLVKGTAWQQIQTDRDGTVRTLSCTIDDVASVAGRTVFMITYQDEGSEYYEKRELRSGIGVYRVETLWMTDDGNFPLEYNLYRSLGPGENT